MLEENNRDLGPDFNVPVGYIINFNNLVTEVIIFIISKTKLLVYTKLLKINLIDIKVFRMNNSRK